jgi:hypothetical protein
MKTLSKISGCKEGVASIQGLDEITDLLGLTTVKEQPGQGIGNTENSYVSDSNVQQGENISYHTQTNNVETNTGVTGIHGTGHTINVYQYPKELTELLTKLMKI